MGTRFSFDKDYNRVLATQPRASINITKFEPPNKLQEQPRAGSFPIPAPVRISRSTDRSKNSASPLPNRSFVVNENIAPLQPLIKSNPDPQIQPTNFSTVIDNQTQQTFKEEKPQQKTVTQSSSYALQPNLPTHHQTMNADAIVISRAVINPNDRQRTRKNYFSSFQPFRTIVEHNGKQFLVEFKERTERRYVQCFDETTHQMRFFEVIDCIPYRIIRPYKHKSQSLAQNNISQNTFLPTLQPTQQLALPSVHNNRSETVMASNPMDNKSLNNRVNLPDENDLQHNNIHATFNNKTSQNLHYASSTSLSSLQSSLIPRSTIQKAPEPIYHHSRYSQPNSSQSLPINSKNISEQFFHQAPSFRTHTPTISDDSVPSSTATSRDSDEEAETDDNENIAQILRSNKSPSGYKQMNSSSFNNRNKTAVPYGRNDGYNSPTPVDPFARSSNPSDRHYYRQRRTIQNYAEPIMNNRRFQQSTYSDYAPIPILIKQSNQNQYSHRNQLQKSIYDD